MAKTMFEPLGDGKIIYNSFQFFVFSRLERYSSALFGEKALDMYPSTRSSLLDRDIRVLSG